VPQDDGVESRVVVALDRLALDGQPGGGRARGTALGRLDPGAS